MKVCTYERNTYIGPIQRLGILLDDRSIIDVNLTWRHKFLVEGYYRPEQRADLLAPASLGQFLKLHQDEAIEKLLQTQELYKEFALSGETHLAFHIQDAKSL